MGGEVRGELGGFTFSSFMAWDTLSFVDVPFTAYNKYPNRANTNTRHSLESSTSFQSFHYKQWVTVPVGPSPQSWWRVGGLDVSSRAVGVRGGVVAHAADGQPQRVRTMMEHTQLR